MLDLNHALDAMSDLVANVMAIIKAEHVMLFNLEAKAGEYLEGLDCIEEMQWPGKRKSREQKSLGWQNSLNNLRPL